MKMISHRGNLDGPNPKWENHPQYITEALEHFPVEIDVWKVGDEFWLGHDAPVHKIKKDFILDQRLLLHCKNLVSFSELRKYPFGEAFFQDAEMAVLTSRGRILFHSSAELPSNLGHDMVVVDLDGDRKISPTSNCTILSDYPAKFSPSTPRELPFDLLILDIDGVMTPGTKYYGPEGNVLAKTYADKDFTAIKRFMKHGVKVCFLSGDETVNKAMAKDRGVDFFYAKLPNGEIDKALHLEDLRARYSASTVAYVGDDYYDLTLLAQVDKSYCPSDAIREVRDLCTATIPRPGGAGVIEALYDMTMMNVGQQFASDTYL